VSGRDTTRRRAAIKQPHERCDFIISVLHGCQFALVPEYRRYEPVTRRERGPSTSGCERQPFRS
jgi:hypothetical protein